MCQSSIPKLASAQTLREGSPPAYDNTLPSSFWFSEGEAMVYDFREDCWFAVFSENCNVPLHTTLSLNTLSPLAKRYPQFKLIVQSLETMKEEESSLCSQFSHSWDQLVSYPHCLTPQTSREKAVILDSLFLKWRRQRKDIFVFCTALFSSKLAFNCNFQCLTKDYHTYPEKYQQWNCHFIVKKENETKRNEIKGIRVRTSWL